MIKVAKHFGFFSRTISGNPQSGSRSKAQFFAELEAEYPPKDGWEIVQANYVSQAPEGYTYGVWLTQFEYVDVPAANVKSK